MNKKELLTILTACLYGLGVVAAGDLILNIWNVFDPGIALKILGTTLILFILFLIPAIILKINMDE